MSTQQIANPTTSIECFGSFAVVGDRYVPVGPLTFAETQGCASYYEVEGTIFRKIGVTRLAQTVEVRGIETQELPGSNLFFAAKSTPGSSVVTVGEPLCYAATEGLTEYFAGPFDRDGRTANLRLYRRSVVFTQSLPEVIPSVSEQTWNLGQIHAV